METLAVSVLIAHLKENLPYKSAQSHMILKPFEIHVKTFQQNNCKGKNT